MRGTTPRNSNSHIIRQAFGRGRANQALGYSQHQKARPTPPPDNPREVSCRKASLSSSPPLRLSARSSRPSCPRLASSSPTSGTRRPKTPGASTSSSAMCRPRASRPPRAWRGCRPARRGRMPTRAPACSPRRPCSPARPEHMARRSPSTSSPRCWPSRRRSSSTAMTSVPMSGATRAPSPLCAGRPCWCSARVTSDPPSHAYARPSAHAWSA